MRRTGDNWRNETRGIALGRQTDKRSVAADTRPRPDVVEKLTTDASDDGCPQLRRQSVNELVDHGPMCTLNAQRPFMPKTKITLPAYRPTADFFVPLLYSTCGKTKSVQRESSCELVLTLILSYLYFLSELFILQAL